jgi:Ran-interacting Mog1 protein
MASKQHLVRRQLFGGAIELTCPQEMLDISDFRPVPDHQEVLLTHDVAEAMVLAEVTIFAKLACVLTEHDAVPMQVFADGANDQSLVVEILVSAHTRSWLNHAPWGRDLLSDRWTAGARRCRWIVSAGAPSRRN